MLELTDSSYIKSNDFIDEFNQIEDFKNDYLTPGRKRILSKTKIKEIDWDFNQDFMTKQSI